MRAIYLVWYATDEISLLLTRCQDKCAPKHPPGVFHNISKSLRPPKCVKGEIRTHQWFSLLAHLYISSGYWVPIFWNEGVEISHDSKIIEKLLPSLSTEPLFLFDRVKVKKEKEENNNTCLKARGYTWSRGIIILQDEFRLERINRRKGWPQLSVIPSKDRRATLQLFMVIYFADMKIVEIMYLDTREIGGTTGWPIFWD